jgi:hypothetical protein
MKAFKQIFFMSIMLTGGSSAFGMSYMNYLKPALCSGLAGSALGVCISIGKINSKIEESSRKIRCYEENFPDNARDAKQFESFFVSFPVKSLYASVYQQKRQEISKERAKLERFLESMLTSDNSPAGKSKFYEACIRGYDCRVEITSKGMEDLHKRVTDIGDSLFYKEINREWPKPIASFFFNLIRDAQEGYHIQKMWPSPKLRLLRACWKYGVPVAIPGFAIGAVCGAALKYALTRKI